MQEIHWASKHTKLYISINARLKIAYTYLKLVVEYVPGGA